MAKAKVRKIDFSPDEFLAAIIGMRWDEIGLYWTACALEMSSGAPIDASDERIFRISGDRKSVTERIIQAVVNRGKLQRRGDKLSNNRVRRELEAAAKRMRSARENGGKGGRPVREAGVERSGSDTDNEQNQSSKKPEAFSADMCRWRARPSK